MDTMNTIDIQNYIKENVPHLLLDDPDTKYTCSEYTISSNFSFLHKLVMETRKHKILEEYLDIYLQTEKGKKELDLKNTVGRTPLMLACCNSNTVSTFETVKKLIENKANLDLQDHSGWTSLMYACFYSNNDNKLEIVKILIDNKANLDLQDNEGLTALMLVCDHSNINSSLETVKILIDNKANLDLRNYEGYTALIYLLLYNNIQDYIEYYKNQDKYMIEKYITKNKILINNYDLLVDSKIISPILPNIYKKSKYHNKLPLRILKLYETKISECMICSEDTKILICNYNHHICFSCLHKLEYKCEFCKCFL